jgi:iduronate 2-sulfatase
MEAVEMLDIYPTLLDLCGLPANDFNEGKSLRPLIENKQKKKDYFAITSYGRNNHAVVSDQFRYIQYEDKTEEFYDHEIDKNEWINKVDDPFYLKKINKLKLALPDINTIRSKNTKNKGVNPYFIKKYTKQPNKTQ